MKEFDRFKMKDIGIIDEFGGKLVEILLKFVVLGVSIEEFKLVKKIFKIFFYKKYIYIVVLLE